MIRHLLCVLLAAGVIAAPNAWAQTAPSAARGQDANARARKHFDSGTRLYKQARYKDAIAEFTAAYKAKPHGVILFNIAQCHEKLGDLPAALRGYAAYLRDLPNADDRETVRVVMKNLEARLAAKGIQQLRVYSQPDQATVFIDGTRRGVTPFSAELPLGTYRVGVEIEGYALNERRIELTSDTSVALDFTLEKRTETVPLVEATPEIVPASATTTLAGPTAVPEPALPTKAPAPPTEAPRSRTWTWVGAGVATVALATAVGFGLSAQSQSHALMKEGPHPGGKATDLRDGALDHAATANVFYGIAGAAGAATVGLFFFEGEF